MNKTWIICFRSFLKRFILIVVSASMLNFITLPVAGMAPKIEREKYDQEVQKRTRAERWTIIIAGTSGVIVLSALITGLAIGTKARNAKRHKQNKIIDVD
ncbi:hypothetical protein Ga0100231_008105 [Opitutaceae bacterium TAV4]|nr:hypothetical protein Ga0100231_008105 [Opitutaceae bacterium TAV4]RRJ98417.1 hypothetical protein Ga0100230_008405 [Opitutaceae bacterium TAV3]